MEVSDLSSVSEIDEQMFGERSISICLFRYWRTNARSAKDLLMDMVLRAMERLVQAMPHARSSTCSVTIVVLSTVNKTIGKLPIVSSGIRCKA